ncbi:MAG: 1-(5-phosphoribosyl)-5-[(5-phosphoribosylamino)methylideneamino]imidazole-4-carboxamide isomerase, partial [Spirochaetaceae bacterium]|nr:1-(5-phosphoribosyl)-5-[(5-phosphoribosylamino)methylideneamino]imidazole-4-carboxamide isomerase [Spirochaetaceae bacterium]
IPAIDLIDGHCVRLTEGVFDTAKIYGDDPAAVARSFAEAGARRLHVVDLDAARGSGSNRDAIKAIRKAFPGILDVGGGIRSIEDARVLKSIGVDLLIAGTALVKKPDDIAAWAEELGPMIVAGIDARDGEVKVSGWEDGSSLRAVDLAAKVRDLGVVEIIYTDISRDGTLSGPNIPETAAIAASSGLPVIISGGVGSMGDLELLAKEKPAGVTGVIFGKALYEGRVNLKEAIQILGGSNE